MAEMNRAAEMMVFVRVVEAGGFAAAARASRLTPSAVSKLVSRLEGRLGTRLINRTTRSLGVTPEGAAFYERSVRILADIDEAERLAGGGERPAGKVRLSTSAAYATHVLIPVLPAFLRANPEISVDLTLTDTVIDLLGESVDVAVRAGPLESSGLIARKLGSTRMVVVGSPDYLARAGTPDQVSDLDRHITLGLCTARSVEHWPFVVDGRPETVPTLGRSQINDGEGLRQMALAGTGLARLARFMIGADIAAGRLIPVLEAFNPGDSKDFHAVYLGRGGPIPARVRALIDFLVERGRIPSEAPR
ncbi:DNA-binding transcriptional LysR family regulator [Amorphus suaedae]